MNEATESVKLITTNILSIPPKTQLVLMGLGVLFLIETIFRAGIWWAGRKKK